MQPWCSASMQAGAVLVAKLSLGALALNDIWFGGQTMNPWLIEEGSSGSSAGPGAATAAGLVGFSIGSETGGSIVSPSMRCGITGLRPTYGRVARTGAMTLCWSLDKLGPMTRSVEDAMLVLDAIHGADAGDLQSVDRPLAFDAGASVRGLRVGYIDKWMHENPATDVDRAALEAAAKRWAWFHRSVDSRLAVQFADLRSCSPKVLRRSKSLTLSG
jgi:Asp-tRNA(Asn)/Glu-tRNA(Gln) amidotransferase A subunit family amidase